MSTPSQSVSEHKAITLPTDDTLLNFFGGWTSLFPLLALLFTYSGSAWCTHVSPWVTVILLLKFQASSAFNLVLAFGVPIRQTVCSSPIFLSKQYEVTRHTLMHRISAYVFDSPIIHPHTMKPFDLDIGGSWFWAPSSVPSLSHLKISNPLLHGRIAGGRILTKCFGHIVMDSLVFIPIVWRYIITVLYSFLLVLLLLSEISVWHPHTNDTRIQIKLNP